jgi:hypothetical protein
MEAGKANPAPFLVMAPVLLLVGDGWNSGKENEPNRTLLKAVPFGAFGDTANMIKSPPTKTRWKVARHNRFYTVKSGCYSV